MGLVQTSKPHPNVCTVKSCLRNSLQAHLSHDCTNNMLCWHAAAKGHPQQKSACCSQQLVTCPGTTLSPHWNAMLVALDALLEVLQAANVPRFLVNKLFQQVGLPPCGNIQGLGIRV